MHSGGRRQGEGVFKTIFAKVSPSSASVSIVIQSHKGIRERRSSERGPEAARVDGEARGRVCGSNHYAYNSYY